MLVVQFHQAGTKRGSSLSNGLIVQPLVRAIGLCDRVVRTPSEAMGFWGPIRGRLEDIMRRENLDRQDQD
jgi:hypothetical protein